MYIDRYLSMLYIEFRCNSAIICMHIKTVGPGGGGPGRGRPVSTRDVVDFKTHFRPPAPELRNHEVMKAIHYMTTL